MITTRVYREEWIIAARYWLASAARLRCIGDRIGALESLTHAQRCFRQARKTAPRALFLPLRGILS